MQRKPRANKPKQARNNLLPRERRPLQEAVNRLITEAEVDRITRLRNTLRIIIKTSITFTSSLLFMSEI